MKKLLLAGMPVLVLLMGVPFAVAAVVILTTTATAGCDAQSLHTTVCPADAEPGITFATLNLLGAGHTDGKPGGGSERPGYESWEKRLPGALAAIEMSGASIAGLQEVHAPQARALAGAYSDQWGMYPAVGTTQNKVIWSRRDWQQTDGRLIDVPYFGGKYVGMPLVQLEGTAAGSHAGRLIWVWSVHNPADSRGAAGVHRRDALRRQLDVLTDIATSGIPVVILGDFNDGNDGDRAAHCILTPTMINAFGGAAEPCEKPKADARVDHIFGAILSWASARIITSTMDDKVSDHPLVVATSAGSAAHCGAGPTACNEVTYPIPSEYIESDNHNWHESGGNWSSWHTGTDFSAPCGTQVYAAHSGTVEIDTTQDWAGPWLLKVSSGPGALTTWYAHMERVMVSRGESVQPGQQIGLVGQEGNATGCHLHFEVHLEGGSMYASDNVDPSGWLAAHVPRPAVRRDRPGPRPRRRRPGRSSCPRRLPEVWDQCSVSGGETHIPGRGRSRRPRLWSP